MADPPLTVNKPSTQMANQVMSVSGTATPNTKVTFSGSWDFSNLSATAGPDGKWGANFMAPDTAGTHTISVSSSDATTSTTFAVKDDQPAKDD